MQRQSVEAVLCRYLVYYAQSTLAHDSKSAVEDLLEIRNNSESYRDWSLSVLGGSGGYWDALGVLRGLLTTTSTHTCDCANPPRGGELQMAVSAVPSPRHAAQARSGPCRARPDAKKRRPAQLRPRLGPRK